MLFLHGKEMVSVMTKIILKIANMMEGIVVEMMSTNVVVFNVNA